MKHITTVVNHPKLEKLNLNQPAPFGGHNQRNNMRIYEVRDASNNSVTFARSFELAQKVVREHNPKARKVSSNNKSTEFSSCWIIEAIDIKPDKAGIISELNKLLTRIEINKSFEPKRNISYEPHIINFPGDEEKSEEPNDNKIGYVGGVPRVNPPAAIRDETRERQKDIEKHRMYSDPDENWSGLR